MNLDVKFDEGENFDVKLAEYLGGGTGSGADGTTFTPAVSAEGIISWTNDGELENPAPVNIKGADGKTPEKGTDYWTATDKAEIVADVLAELPTAESEVY